MKKFLSIMLAAAMTLTMSVAAFAEDPVVTPTAPTPATPVTEEVITKNYTVNGQVGDSVIYPAETLNFVSTPDTTNPTAQNLTITPLEVSGLVNNLSITTPAFTTPGVYHFTITETDNGTQGVTYATSAAIDVVVLVQFKEGTAELEAIMGVTSSDGTANGKVDEITNTYNLGSLKVTKTVSGNLAVKNQPFDIVVTFESNKPVRSDVMDPENPSAALTWTPDDAADPTKWTATTTISVLPGVNNAVTFNNIPVGVTYTVDEDDKYEAEDANGSNPEAGYTVTYNGAEVESATGSISSTPSEATVNNHKGVEVDTGIGLDSLPYMLLLVGAMVGLGVVVLKKRQARED